MIRTLILTLELAAGQDVVHAAGQTPLELERHLLELKRAHQADALKREQAVDEVKRHVDVAQEKVLPALQTIGTEMAKLNRHFEEADFPAIIAALEAQKTRSALTSVKEFVGVLDSGSSVLMILLVGAVLGPTGLKRLMALLLGLRKGDP